jgi:nucleotidyltransferase-like protein
MTGELEQLVNVLAQWLEPAEGFHAYLFGSRVRGDHRPDSDVDVRIFLKDCQPTHESAEWWTRQNETDFAAVKELLPGPFERPGHVAFAVARQQCKKPKCRSQ